MNASNRNLLAIALTTMLLSSVAWAQKVGLGNPLGQTVHGASQAAQDAMRNASDQTMRDIHKPATQTTEQVKDTTMPPPSPPKSQGAAHAAANSSVVQRDLWAKLDIDGDGKISTTEAAADVDFNGSFTTMDADNDGFVTATEYRAGAKSELRSNTGGTHSASRSRAGMRDLMARLDTNADGSISLSEGDADATIKANFSAIDSNTDGLVSSAEYHAWLKANHK